MAYRRPAIEVIQEFQSAAAALALPSLPACVVGPGFQVKDDVVVGTYSEDDLGISSYEYTGLVSGGIVDLSAVPDTEAEANAHKPVGVKLTDLYLEKKARVITGKLVAPNLFQDATTGAFATFDPDAAGAPTFYVEVVSGAGVGAGDLGRKLVIAKNSDNELVVAAEWVSGGLPLTNITYRILEFRASEVYPTDSLSDNGITPDADSVDIDPGLATVTDATPLPVVEATVTLSWRALRPDLAGSLNVFTGLDSLEAIFGVGSVVPSNIGAYGVNLALLNTTTPINYTGLNGDFFDSEEQSWQAAFEFLEAKDVYGIAALSHLPAVHQLVKTHVEGMSLSTVGRERVGFFNRKLSVLEVLIPSSGIGTKTSAGSGNGTSGTTNKTFKDPTNGSFITDDVQVGNFLEVIAVNTQTPGVQRSVTPDERDYLSNGNTLIQLTGGNFGPTDVGKQIIIRGATTAANNIVFTITDDLTTKHAEVTPAPNTGEVMLSTTRAWIASITQTISHKAADAVVAATKTWSFVNGVFTADDIGRILFIAGAATGGNNGAFIIGEIVSGTSVKTIEAPAGNETFGGGVTQKVYAIDREPGRDISADKVTGSSRQWTIINGAFTAADIGRKLRVTGAQTGANNADHVIESIISPSVVKTDNTTTPVTEEFNGLLGSLSVLDVRSVTLSTDESDYLIGTRHEISAIVSETQLTLAADPTSGFGGTLAGVEYRITKDLTLNEQADFIAGYASSFASRRCVHTWPDVLAVSVNSQATKVPGYFAGAVFVGMTAGLPSQQGFTNLQLTGFIGREHSDDRFSDTQLDTIAGGGNLVLTQPVVDAALSVRHQLTTDVSTIFFQEFSVTKNVDLCARFFRGLFKPFIGIYNVYDGLLDILKTRSESGITFLKNQRAQRIGAPLRNGQLSRIEESADQPDSVEIDITINVPLPLNNLKLTLLV
jgi:hypothetical protein